MDTYVWSVEHFLAQVMQLFRDNSCLSRPRTLSADDETTKRQEPGTTNGVDRVGSEMRS